MAGRRTCNLAMRGRDFAFFFVRRRASRYRDARFPRTSPIFVHDDGLQLIDTSPNRTATSAYSKVLRRSRH